MLTWYYWCFGAKATNSQIIAMIIAIATKIATFRIKDDVKSEIPRVSTSDVNPVTGTYLGSGL